VLIIDIFNVGCNGEFLLTNLQDIIVLFLFVWTTFCDQEIFNPLSEIEITFGWSGIGCVHLIVFHHDDLGLDLGADSVKVIPDTAYAANIMAKYRTEAFGLSMAKWKVIFEDKGAKDDLIRLIRETLWQ
jgi:hypothetical protein